MATTESISSAKPGMSIKRKAAYLLLALLVLAAALFIYNLGSIKGQARLGSAYGAHIVCSCRYIEGRDLESCESDMEEGMGIISLSDDTENKRVTASVPFFAREIAEFRGDFGCIVLNEAEREAAD
ncbi:MAG: hypothetical protein V3V15_12405 [Sphingorhabdus sp.]